MTQRRDRAFRSTFLLALASTGASVLSACAGAGACPSGAQGSPVLSRDAGVGDDGSVRSGQPRAPVARRVPRTLTLHGRTRQDDYQWLQAKGTAEVEDHLRAENAYVEEVMRPTEPLQRRLYGELLAHTVEADASAPSRRGDFDYYWRTEPGRPYRVHCRRRAKGGAEEVLLDVNAMAAGKPFLDVEGDELSDDGHLLAYRTDETGFRQYQLHVKDLRTGRVLPERMDRVTSAAFSRDGRQLFYTVEHPTTKRSYQLFRHAMGTETPADVLVYEDADEHFDLTVKRSRSGAYLFATSMSATTSEVRALRRDGREGSGASFVVVAPRVQGEEYEVDHGGDTFYVRTNAGGRNFRLCTAKALSPDRARWKEIVPHREEVMLLHVDAFADHLVLTEREAGVLQLRVTNLDGTGGRRVALPEPSYELAASENDEFHAKSFRFEYESVKTPPTVMDVDVRTGALSVVKRTPVPGYDPATIEARRVVATAKDGTQVPISLYRRAGGPSGPAPLLLEGYGAYGYAVRASFQVGRLALLERGVTLASAHARGGGELGKAWHDGGRMEHKMNTFTDFIAASEYLLQEGWTSRDRLAIYGRSAGGLLVGAVVNLRPELFRAAVAAVPFVDVLNTMLDPSSPLVVGEYEEWGNPQNPDEYDRIAAYSPYDNVAPKAYPEILALSSYNDSQVMYWEPAKWVARLRATKTDDRPILLRVNLDAGGHRGRSSRYDRAKEAAFEAAWLLTRLGVERSDGAR